ncbi:MAG: diguanylate cyclase [Motiliproteus sp.]
MDELNKQGTVDDNIYKQFLLIQKEFFEEVLLIFEFSVINRLQFVSITNLMNRRTVDTVLAHEKHRMSRIDDSTCCIALADIDQFKLFNDSYGHDVGDMALQHTAKIFDDGTRATIQLLASVVRSFYSFCPI